MRYNAFNQFSYIKGGNDEKEIFGVVFGIYAGVLRDVGWL